MNNKKIIIMLTIILAGLLVIGAASAADVDANDTAILSAGENDEIVSVENDLDVLGADSVGSYSDLATEISKPGNIVLKYKNYTYDGSAAISIGEDNKIIDGNGSTIDMTGSNIRAFEVQTFGVTIKNLTIKNANFDDGGAIYFSDSGIVINCNFTDNAALSGGAIEFDGTGTVTNCNFVNNAASLDGGAIRFNGEGTVENCNFTNNSAGFGGAIGFCHWSGGTVKSCNFDDNKANDGNGGAIFFLKGTSNVTNCNFTDNAALGGGAIFSDFESTGNVTNCNFTGNNATAEGGAVLFLDKGTVENCNFTDNHAKRGGAVRLFAGKVTNCIFTGNNVIDKVDAIGGAVYFTNGNVANCIFTNNSASGKGGAVCFTGNGDVANCIFTNNTATNGGAINMLSGTVTNCNFTGNNATTGSAICFQSTSATKTVSNSRFLNNRANAETLEVTKNDNNITITFTGKDNLLNAIYSNGDVTFTNVVYWGANGISNTGSSAIKPSRSNREAGQNITVEIYDSYDRLVDNVTLVTNDKGQVTYDLLKLSNDNYTCNAYHIEDCYYTYVEHKDMGDFNRLQKYINGTEENSILTLYRDYTFTIGKDENLTEGIVIDKPITINGNGHTINALEKARIFNVTAADVVLKNITFKNGNTFDEGGAIHWSANNANISGCSFEYNQGLHSSAIFFSNMLINSNIDATFKSNEVKDPVLGIGANYFAGELINVTISGNFIGNKVAANYFASRLTNVNISGNFTANKVGFAAQGGGANYFAGELINVTISGNFNNNEAVSYYGGANYFLSRLTNVNISGNFTGNKAASSGGANYFGGELINVTISGNFNNNEAVSDGGANKFLDGLTNVNISGNFTGNKAGGDGGVNHFSGDVKNLNMDGNYEYNSAGRGGVNFFCGNLNNASITGNYAHNTADGDGGVNYFWDINGTTINGNYSHNKASGGGGVNNFEFKITNINVTGNFINNTAQEDGSASYFRYLVSPSGDHSEVINVTVSGSFINNPGNSVIYMANSTQNNIIRDSAFINNTATNIVVGDGNLAVLDNWFANNASNYDVNITNSKGVTIDNWLFLNATANPGEIEINENSTILFELKSYSKSGIGDYDSSKMNVMLGLSNTLGKLNQSAVQIGKEVVYTAGESGDASVTAEFETASYTVSLKNKLISTEISIANSTVNLTVFEIISSGATLTPADAGNLTYTSSDESVAKVEYGQIIGVNEGNATITVSFAGDSQYAAAQNKTITVFVTLNDASISFDSKSIELKVGELGEINYMTDPESLDVFAKSSNSSVAKVDFDNNVAIITAVGEGNATITFTINQMGYFANSSELRVTVKKENLTIKATAEPITLGENATVIITGLENATGNVSVRAGDGIYNDTVSKGTAKVIIPGLIVNTTAEVRYLGDGKYNRAFTEIVIVVNPKPKENATITIDALPIEVGDNATVTVILPEDAKGNVTIGNEVVSIKMGIASAILTNLPAGNTTVPITYSGDEKYNPIETSVNVTVNKIDPEITIGDIAATVGETVNATVTISGGDAGGNVTYDGVDYPVKNGQAVIPVVISKAGMQAIAVEYSGDGKYNNGTANKAFNAGKGASSIEMTLSEKIKVGENATLTVTVSPDAATGTVSITVDGKPYDNLTLNAGMAKVEVSGLTNGTHTITAQYMGDVNYNASDVVKKSVVVDKIDPSEDIKIEVDEAVFGKNATVNVFLLSDAKGTVGISVDGNEVATVPVENGKATATLPELSMGTHKVEVTYSGDDKYASSTKAVDVTVSKQSTALNAENVTTTYNINKDLVIELTDSQGNPIANAVITVNLNEAKNYTTDKNGQVKINAGSLIPKSYSADISFAGNENYTASNATAKVTVKKATPSLTAKSKSFQDADKAKRYAIVLKDNTGKPIKKVKVYLKVNGRIYTAVTDNNGKAIFKLTKLTKKGTYKALIVYKGDNKYNKIGKKVKIAVKTAFKTVGPGSKDKSTVKKIQKALKNKGFYLTYKGHYLMIDGYYGSCTQRSVKEFQSANGLKVTGSVDYKTAKKLGII